MPKRKPTEKVVIDVINRERRDYFIFSGYIIMAIFFAGLMIWWAIDESKLENNYLVPKNVGSAFPVDGKLIIVFDLADRKQLELARTLEQVCAVNEIKNCMSSFDVLNVRGQN